MGNIINKVDLYYMGDGLRDGEFQISQFNSNCRYNITFKNGIEQPNSCIIL